MKRFLIGFAAGALVLSIIQYVFGPVPTMEHPTTYVDTQRKVPSDEDFDIDHGNLQGAQDTQFDGADHRQLSGRIEAPASIDNINEAVEPESEHSADTIIGPENPIVLPDTHAGFVDRTAPSLPDEHAIVEEEKVDSGWAENVEVLIYTFITSHPRGDLIQVVSIVCRTTRCEIVGSVFGESGDDIWNTVLGDMRTQPWFSSNFADSMFGSGGAFPGEYRFITILARVGSEIGSPVEQ